MEGTRLMTVRGFLAWYLGTVAMVSAAGAVMWHGIQLRKHAEIAAVVAPQPPATPAPPQTVAEAQPQQPVVEQNQTVLPALRPHRSSTASLPLPPLHAAPPPDRSARVASGATQPWTPTAKPRAAARVTARAPSYRYQYPPSVAVREAEPYPGYGSGSYVVAYPPAMVAPWQMSASSASRA